MTADELRAQEVKTLVGWMPSEEAASAWLWSCTPYPCGLPSDEQIEEGLKVATGEYTIEYLVEKAHREMDEAWEEYRAQNPDAWKKTPAK